MSTGMSKMPVHQFQLPEGLKPVWNFHCQVHGIQYGVESCQSCLYEKERQQRRLGHRLEEFGLPDKCQAKTLDGFVIESPAHQSALDLAVQFANGDIRNLLMVGIEGTGKTHLAAGILNHLNNSGQYDCLYTTAERMLKAIRACYGATGDAEQRTFDFFIHPTVLIIDEFDKIKSGPDEVRIVSELIRDRDSYGRRLALIANGNLDRIRKRMDKSAADRMYENGKVNKAMFTWPSWRRRKAT